MAGGMIPASIIAETLKIRDIRPISIERRGNERTIAYDIIGNLNGLKILLVEDALPTGRGSVVIKHILIKRATCNVKISAVYVTSQSVKVTDFFAKQIDPLPNLPWKPSRTGD